MKISPILRCFTALSFLAYTLTGSQIQPRTVFAQAPIAGFFVSPTSGLTTTESGQTANFTIVLTAPPDPSDQVHIALESTNEAEGRPFPTSLVFDITNWNQAQTITITGQDDWIDDGDQTYNIVTHPAESNLPDSTYAGLNPDDVSLTNLDDDTAGFTVNPLSGLTTSESGQTASFTVRLNSQPHSDVFISLESSNSEEGIPAPDILTFTPNNWQNNQTVTVTGQDDAILDGNQTYTIQLSVFSDDQTYQQLEPPAVSVTNLDNEQQVVINAEDDSYSLMQGETFSQPAPGVLANDTTNTGSLIAELATSVNHGTLDLDPNGSFIYTPNADYSGSDSFTYRARNGSVVSDPTTVTLTIRQQIIIITQADSYITNQDQTLEQPKPGVLANDSTNNGTLTAALYSSVAHGSLTLNQDGSFVYTPAPGYSGSDSFTYRALNGGVVSNPTTVSLTVNITVFVSAEPDSYTTNEDQELTVPAPGVLANDSRAQTALLATNVSHGTLTFESNGAFVYTPASGVIGNDSFTYTAHAGPFSSQPATVSIDVLQANLPPTAANDTYLTNATNTAPFTVPAPGLLANDSDPENGPLTASFVDQPNHGSLVINTNGAFTYTPPAGFHGIATFTYQVTDDGGKTATASVVIEVDIVAPPPVNWVQPNTDGSINPVDSESVRLEVTVDPDVADLARVVFYRWDPVSSQRIELGSRTSSPFAITINTSTLQYQWNQIDAAAIDHAGNRSTLQHIWVLRSLPPVAYLPIIVH